MAEKSLCHFAPLPYSVYRIQKFTLHSAQTCHSERTVSAALIAWLVPQE